VTVAAEAGLPTPSVRWSRGFAHYNRRYLARHFHALRLARDGGAPDPGDRPLVIYTNHPSWWDPLVGLYLAARLFPERDHRIPMEARAVERYRFFEKLGVFGVEPGGMGARRLLRQLAMLFDNPLTTVWITPEGRFRDPRARPLDFQPGLGMIARHLRRGLFVPLAVEYPFWEERFPEVLLRFGEPLDASEIMLSTAADYQRVFAERLTACQDALARLAIAREREAFRVLLGGRAGVGGVYDAWRRLLAGMRGERFRPEHGLADVEERHS